MAMKKNKKKNKKKKVSKEKAIDSSSINYKKIVSYLQLWKTNRSEWKFEKVKQMRLVAGMLDSDKVPDDVFPILMEYMESSKGKIRDTVISKATEIIDQMEKWSSLSDEEKTKATSSIKQPDVKKYNRARLLLQHL